MSFKFMIFGMKNIIFVIELNADSQIQFIFCCFRGVCILLLKNKTEFCYFNPNRQIKMNGSGRFELKFGKSFR